MEKTETNKNRIKITLWTLTVLALLFAFHSRHDIYWKIQELRHVYSMWGKVVSSYDGTTNYEIYNSEQEKVMFEAIMAGDLPTIRASLSGSGMKNIHATFERRGCFSGNSDETVLHAGIKHPAAIELLLGYGAKTGGFDYQGRTPLMWAVKKGEVDTIKVLLEHGADPNLKNKHGRVAKDYVTDKIKNKMEVLEALSLNASEKITR